MYLDPHCMAPETGICNSRTAEWALSSLRMRSQTKTENCQGWVAKGSSASRRWAPLWRSDALHKIILSTSCNAISSCLLMSYQNHIVLSGLCTSESVVEWMHACTLSAIRQRRLVLWNAEPNSTANLRCFCTSPQDTPDLYTSFGATLYSSMVWRRRGGDAENGCSCRCCDGFLPCAWDDVFWTYDIYFVIVG